MQSLVGKNMVVIGGSRGVGRRIVETAAREGAKVLAVARQEEPLRRLAEDMPGVLTLSLDATDEDAPHKVYKTLPPDILVISGSALQRARKTLAKRRQTPETFRALPKDRDLLGRYMKAWESNDPAAYSRARKSDPWTAHSLQIPTLGQGGIAALTLFVKPDSPRLFESFALPLVLT